MKNHHDVLLHEAQVLKQCYLKDEVQSYLIMLYEGDDFALQTIDSHVCATVVFALMCSLIEKSRFLSRNAYDRLQSILLDEETSTMIHQLYAEWAEDRPAHDRIASLRRYSRTMSSAEDMFLQIITIHKGDESSSKSA